MAWGDDGGQVILLVEDNPDDVTLTLRAFRKNDIDNEVVVARDGAEAGYESGANSYVRKPVDFEQLVEAARELGLYWLVLDRKPAAPLADSSPSGE